MTDIEPRPLIFLGEGVLRFDLVAHIHRARAFSEKTFGPGSRSHGVVEHIRRELCEIEAKPDDLEEWIDVMILAIDGAWRAGYEPEEIVAALAAKQTKNEARKWPDWRTVPEGTPIEHDRSGEDVAHGISALKGRTLAEIKHIGGDEELIFTCDRGDRFRMYHEQDCCEGVRVEEIVGNLGDLIGVPILVAEERTEDDPGASESGTWTFYELRTIKGSVTIRWYGASNGWYSESVSFEKME